MALMHRCGGVCDIPCHYRSAPRSTSWRAFAPCLRAVCPHREAAVPAFTSPVLVPAQANGTVLPVWLYVGGDTNLGQAHAHRVLPLAPIASIRSNPEKPGKID